eukprot:54215-Alexandrium_andersonii.AAC.1
MLYSVGGYVRENMRISREAPPLQWKRLHTALITLVSLAHTRGAINGQGAQGTTTWWDDLLFLVSVLNGDWTSKYLIHHCNGCCTSPTDTYMKIVAVVSRIKLRCRPGVPALSRWQTMGPSLD